MNERLLPIFVVSPDRLDRATVEVVRVIHFTAVRQGVKYFLCGATARDVILSGVFGLAPGRATVDLDFGFAVKS
ncbi:MAG TPA: hypothetical protein VNW97_05115 [Candidatus Saccharimonadales bacterium]|nr:hypothetical protein [Candidatus Saccharimonadales bacterium]